MQPSPYVTVEVNLAKLRENVAAIARKTGVPIYAVIKADGYGLGSREVARAIADQVHGYYCFSLREAIEANVKDLNKPTLVISLAGDRTPAEDFIAHNVRPIIATIEDAARLRTARPVLSIDTGMQRFAISPADVHRAIEAGGIDEVMTHATRIVHVELLNLAIGNHRVKRHAAGSALLDEPAANLDYVRPGMAMYRGVARVTAPLLEVHDSGTPAGYTGFVVSRLGVILCGYSNGMRKGLVMINGRKARVLEVGMQSSFIELAPGDKSGDVVTLLGDGLTEAELATAWSCGEHEVCVRMGHIGQRRYVQK